MKTRHLLATAACMAAMALAATGCSKDELTDATGNTPTGDNAFSFTASTPAPKPATRLEYTEGSNADPLVVEWASGEEAFFALNAGSTATWKGIKGVKASTGAASKTATFVAKDTDGTDASTCEAGSFYALYPAKDALRNLFANISTSGTYYIYLQLNGQTGKLADMHNFDYMTAEATITGSSTEAPDLAFSHRISVLRLSGLTFSGLNGGSATNISISGTGLKNSADLVMTGSATPTVRLNGPDAILTTTGTFTIGSDGKLTENVYICFFPPEEGISNLRITATVGGTNYGYSYSGTVGTSANPFEEGNMYTLSDAAMEGVILYNYTLEEQESEVGTKPTLQTTGQENSESNPYLITTREELQWLKMNPKQTYYYKLMKDVEVRTPSWHPIGNNGKPFEGHFDGNNKKIMGSMKSYSSTAHFGFFGYGENAHIKNLHMKASIDRSGTSPVRTGGIIGEIYGGNIEHCTNAADIKNSNGGDTGGIAGSTNKVRITACTNTGNISLSTDGSFGVGGICGSSYNNGSSIAGCINKGTVSFSGTSGYSGGIVGNAYYATVTACWNNATEITGGSTTGAIVGKNAGSNTFNACYWKHQDGLAGINGSSTTSSTGTFTDAAPTTEQISTMNTKWEAEDSSGRKYQFNATTGEIEPKP